MRWWRGVIADGARRPAQDGGGPRTGRRAVRGSPTVTGQRSSPLRARWRAADRRGSGRWRLLPVRSTRRVRSRSSCSRPLDEQGDGVAVPHLLEARVVGGTPRGGTGHTTSPAMPSAARLVARMCSDGQRRSRRCATDAHASRRCSQVSSTRSPGRWPMCNVTPSSGSGLDVTPSARAISSGTTVGSVTSPSSTNHAGSCSASACATASARLVLPAPPGPVSVTSRSWTTAPRTRAISLARPTRRVVGEGNAG